jgi:hypothetical protein
MTGSSKATLFITTLFIEKTGLVNQVYRPRFLGHTNPLLTPALCTHAIVYEVIRALYPPQKEGELT